MADMRVKYFQNHLLTQSQFLDQCFILKCFFNKVFVLMSDLCIYLVKKFLNVSAEIWTLIQTQGTVLEFCLASGSVSWRCFHAKSRVNRISFLHYSHFHSKQARHLPIQQLSLCWASLNNQGRTILYTPRYSTDTKICRLNLL